MLRREVKYDRYTNKYSFIFNGHHSTLVSLAYDQLCIDLTYIKSEHERYSMNKELVKKVVIDEVKSERIEKEKETKSNESKK